MIEKIGKQENLPQKMGIISILKMKILIFFRFFIFLHVKTFLFSTPCFRYPIFFLNFFVTESDTVGPQLFTWSKKFRNDHIKVPKFFFINQNFITYYLIRSKLSHVRK